MRPVVTMRALTVTTVALLWLAVTATAAVSRVSPAGPPSAPMAAPVSRPAPVPSPVAHPARDVCATVTRPGWVGCLSKVRTDVRARKGLLAAAATPQGYGPSALQNAYLLPSATGGSGQTVAVVDAYDDPQAESDLQVYRAQYGLPACDTANGCFRKVAQDGSAGFPPANSDWALEESLDIDMVSAICPNCHILLLEANDASLANVSAAVNEAVRLGARYVSNSYGGLEQPSQTSADSAYNHPGVVITASSGDSGYGVQYPAASPYVTAVGGTSLIQDPSVSRGWAETAWQRASSGCSAYEAKPSWQADSGCANRSVSDVSAVADPNTGVAVYDTGPGYSGWQVVGGTSVASPVIAAVYALAGTPAAGTYPASYPYADPSDLNDVTSGTNGICGVGYLCSAGPGYDGPTGLGTPHGVSAFAAGPHGTVAGTVIDASTGRPLAGAEVDIGSRPVRTSASGTYSLPVPAGSFAVTVSYFGYAPQTATGLTVTSGVTTTRNFALRPLPSVTLSGQVADGSGHGWPLYAKIAVSGTPLVTYTDPATGRYSLAVPDNATYNVTADPVSPGYQQALRTVQVATSNLTQDFSATVIAQTCGALGYHFLYSGVTQGFDAATAPAGWLVVDAGGTSYGWEFGNSGGRPNSTGGSGNFAIADSGFHQAPEDTELISPVVDMAHDTMPYLQFNSDLEGIPGEADSVGVSINDGQTWTTVMSVSGYPGHPGPSLITIPLPMGAGQPDVRVRFHYVSDAGKYWGIDNVFLGNRGCVPTPGGLVEGQVTDANTGAGLNGATVVTGSDQIVTAAPAPGDPAIDGGFYDTFLPAGSRQFAASMPRYASAAATATVTADAVTTVNLTLQAGQLSVTPGAISAATGMGGSSVRQIAFTDTGKAPVRVTLYNEPGEFNPIGAAGTRSGPGSGAALRRISGSFSPLFSSRPTAASGAATGPAVMAGDAPWLPMARYPIVIMDNAVATDQATGLVYSLGGLTSSGVTTAGYVYDPRTGQWAALPPMQNEREAAQAAFINGKLYVAGGWNRFGQPVPQLEIYDPGSRTWSSGAPDPAPYAGAGTAVVNGRMYVVGGCADICTASQVEVYDPAANAWSAAAPYPVGAGWLGCGTIAGNIYCAGGVTYQTGITNAYAYSPASGAWFAISPLPIDLWGGGYTAANGELLISGGVTSQGTVLTNQGFAFDPSVGSWSALPNSGAPVYRAGSACGLYLIGGSTGGLNPTYAAQQLPGYAACGSARVPWLTGSPDSFTVNPGATVIVTETLNAGDPSVTEPGSYTASLAIRNDAPYLAPGSVAVTMDAG